MAKSIVPMNFGWRANTAPVCTPTPGMGSSPMGSGNPQVGNISNNSELYQGLVEELSLHFTSDVTRCSTESEIDAVLQRMFEGYRYRYPQCINQKFISLLNTKATEMFNSQWMPLCSVRGVNPMNTEFIITENGAVVNPNLLVKGFMGGNPAPQASGMILG